MITDGCVVLARHGQTTLNADGRLRGHLDPPLDAVGEREAQDLARALQALRAQVIVSSPLQRAMQTAAAIAAPLGATVRVDDRLIDRDYGPWAGEPLADVIAEWGDVDNAPGVESAAHVIARARAALDEYGDRHGVPSVLVAHDAVNRLLLTSVAPHLGPPEFVGQRTGCWNVMHRENGSWLVDRVDEKTL